MTEFATVIEAYQMTNGTGRTGGLCDNATTTLKKGINTVCGIKNVKV